MRSSQTFQCLCIPNRWCATVTLIPEVSKRSVFSRGDASGITGHHTHRRSLIYKCVMEEPPEKAEEEHDLPKQKQDETVLHTPYYDPSVLPC